MNTGEHGVRIVVIEDSPIMLAALVALYEEDPTFQVVATATTEAAGIAAVGRRVSP